MPRSSERLDPPLIDVFVEDGYRDGDINRQEARFIVDEIKAITTDPALSSRSIGVVSLLGNKQPARILDMISSELDMDTIFRHNIACGDAMTFQGKERDIMFLSMVAAPNNIGAPLTRDTFKQRFNVAASRARDRMYLVRPVSTDDLSPADVLRRGLIAHFRSPFSQDDVRIADLKTLCESDFERQIYDELTGRGYCVTPQVVVGQFRIDMVVEGSSDTRLAIECDGDKYHGPEKWLADVDRQRILERAGWTFWRCFASAFVRHRKNIVNDLLQTLSAMGIWPSASASRVTSVHVEHRVASGTHGKTNSAKILAEIDLPDSPATCRDG